MWAALAALAGALLAPGLAAAQIAPFLVAPNGGEVWAVGTDQEIRWAGEAGSNVRIELSRDSGVTWQTLFSNTPNDGVQKWQVVGPPSEFCRVRITRLDDVTFAGVSADDFTIGGAGLAVLTPNGGDVWAIGSRQAITWASQGIGNVRVELSRDGGVLWETLFSNTRDDGIELWTVEGAASSVCLVRVTSLDDTTVSDTSDGLFIITGAAGLAVTGPNGGELWTTGSLQTIHWLGFGGGRVAVELSRDGGDSWETLFESTPDDGARDWIVTGPATDQALIRVSRNVAPFVSDVSDAVFAISSDPIAVVLPRGGEDWVIGTQQQIQWSGPAGGTVVIELSRNGGVTWETIAENIRNDGAQFWTVVGAPTDDAVVRITSVEDPTLSAMSEDFFHISRGTLALTAPNGGEVLAAGGVSTLTWSTTTGGSVRLELSRDGGGTFETIIANTPNDGSEPWTVTGPACTNCRLRVTSWIDAGLTDESDGDFAIVCMPIAAPITPGVPQDAALENRDCDAPHRSGARGDDWSFSMATAGLVSVEVRSSAFDAYVLLLGPDGTVLAERDGGGGGTDARIDSIDLAAGGPYTIEVTSTAPAATGALGPYTVVLSRYDVEVLTPTSGELWRFGERHLITWRSGAPEVPADIAVFRNGATGEPIAVALPNDGSEGWTATGPPTDAAVFQVCIPYGSRGTKICASSAAIRLEPCAPGSTHACYDGPAGTLGVGQCTAGTQSCAASGVFGECHGTVGPETEICGDGLDQDCDGSDAACIPCPGTTPCPDDDPCTNDACVEGTCRQDRPTGWVLLGCRTSVFHDALLGLDAPCADDKATKLRARYRRRLARLFATVQRLARRAEAHPGRPCIARLTRARLKTIRLRQLVDLAGARGGLCGADPAVLARRVDELAIGILSASTCPLAS